MNIELIEIVESDYEILKDIYDYYIIHSTATFHTEKISIEELKQTIPLNHPKFKSYLINYDGNVCGYGYFSHFKPRQAYDRSSEITIYLKPEFHGKGIGKVVMDLLEEKAKENGIEVLIGIITAENTGSTHLFEKCDYEKCAHYKQIGEKFGRILDVVAYQKFISPTQN